MTPSASCRVVPVSSSMADVDLRPDQAAAALGLAPGHGHALEAELGDGARLVALEGYPAGVRAQPHEVGAEPERGLGVFSWRKPPVSVSRAA